MIRRQWYVVLESKEVKAGKPVGVTRMGEKLVFWRGPDGKVSCLSDICAHRGASLALGELHGDRVMCPFHGLEYAPDGKCVRIPANGRDASVPPNFRVASYPAHEAHGFVSIWWGDNPPADLAPPAFFDDLPEGMKWATVRDPWRAHYSRVIENQLDCVHLPFIHRSTIGRGNRTLVNGPGVKWTGADSFDMFVYNEVDSGQKPKKPDEVPMPSPSGYKIEFRFPNLWENRIAGKMRVLAAFAPVDAENTLLYLRVYQGFMTWPLVRAFMGWMISKFNLVVAHQDRRVVETQVPKASGLRIGENLFQGDKPIMEYRRRRQELIEAASKK